MARQIPGGLQIDLTVGEQGIDVVGAHLELGHARPPRGDHVLGVVLVGEQPDGAGLDPQRDVLADQRDLFAFGGQVGGDGQDAGVVASVRNPEGSTL